jgi:hypothetical protein
MGVEQDARALTPPAAALCPAGVAVQTLTVVNQANVRPWALENVENAIVAQSIQLDAAWGTPCVQFGPSGWLIYLQTGYEANPAGGYTMQIGGEHYGLAVPGPDYQGQPYAIVDTGASGLVAWSYALSHEVAEMLEDPNDNSFYTWPNGQRALHEICDPIEGTTYVLDGVRVDDFTLPAAWSGGPGPYDEAHTLSDPLTPGYTLGLS